ncbi:hypothetical protein FS837_006162, partial [Tulasnella sp. UAMH 9824]
PHRSTPKHTNLTPASVMKTVRQMLCTAWERSTTANPSTIKPGHPMGKRKRSTPASAKPGTNERPAGHCRRSAG